jgi:hypothetical protein
MGCTPLMADNLFEGIHGALHLSLADVRRFASKALVLIYTPKIQGP